MTLICINFQYFYAQKTAKFSGAPPLTRYCVDRELLGLRRHLINYRRQNLSFFGHTS
jgi:hypothetical protein